VTKIPGIDLVVVATSRGWEKKTLPREGAIISLV